MKRFWLTAALLLMVGCTNDEATNDTRDLVDDTEQGVEDLVDDTERGVDNAGDAFTDDHNDHNNATGDGMGPITESPNDVNGGVNGNGGMVDDNGNVNNNNEAVIEGKTNDAELQKKKND